MLQICENIRLAREITGMSQEEVALKLGKHRNTYQNWETNTEPSLPIIKAIAQVLNVPVYTLLTGIIDFDPNETPKEINQAELQQVKESLRTLALSVGRIAGLSIEQTYEVFSFSASGNKLEKQAHRVITKGKPKGKSSKRNR